MSRFVVSMLVIASIACSDLTAPLPREGIPQEFEFSISGFGAPYYHWRVEGETVVFKKVEWGLAPSTRRVVPTSDAWRAFWVAADQVGVGRWRSSYVAEGIVDGEGWGLRLVAGSARIESTGSNAYPDQSGREHEQERTADFQSFLSALYALVGEQR